MVTENERKALPGIPMIGLLLLASAGGIWQLVRATQVPDPRLIVAWAVALTVVFILWFGLFMVQPNTAQALLLFGDYKGSSR